MPGATHSLDCRLRCLPLFVAMAVDEIAFMRRFKSGEATAALGTEILRQG